MAVTAQAYTEQLQALLPAGAAWTRQAETTLSQLLAGLAFELARLDARAEDLLRESDPRTTAELLTDWERALDLPGPCGVLAPTLQERRRQVLAKLTAIGGQSRAYFIALAATLGYAVTITEYHPFRAGRSRAGDSLTNESWIHRWMVNAPAIATTVVTFSAGQSAAGEPLRSWGEERLECPIRLRKPAHTGVTFSYGG